MFREATKAEITKEMRKRKRDWDKLKKLASQGSVKAANELQVFEALYVENGKLILVQFTAALGRRSHPANEPAAMLERLKKAGW